MCSTRSPGDQEVSSKRALLEDIADMVNRLNEQARISARHDPLLNTEYHLSMTAPMGRDGDSEGAITVRITIVYLSGHGEETSHVLNDIASFTVTDTAITDVEFQGQDTEAIATVPLTGVQRTAFIDRIRTFCERRLPQSGL